MRITFFYSAKDSAIVAVMGDELKQGAMAVGMEGTDDAGTLRNGAEPMAVIDDVIKTFRKSPFAVPFYFMSHGGTVNDKDVSHYTKLASVDLSDDDSEAGAEYVGE